MSNIRIFYKKLVPEAKDPIKFHKTDLGFDLYAISKKETDKYIEYGTGLAFEIPEGFGGFVFPRSSVTKEDLILKNSVGVIDPDYRGEIKFRYSKLIHNLFNFTSYSLYDPKINNFVDIPALETKRMINENEISLYDIGDRVGQIIILELPKVYLLESEDLSDTNRGSNGYGSTGKK